VSPLSRSQANRLGDRLRAAATISDVASDDLDLLQDLRAQYDAQLAIVRQRLATAFPDAAVTSRLKTVQTIHEKLLRERAMALGRMQDIAGIRVVKEMGRLEQDIIAAAILETWPGSRLADRRLSPSFGYRAVHVVVNEGDCIVEIQVRTVLQNTWAQVVERLGDAWGRQIRYGESPDDPGRVLPGNVTRQEAWGLVLELSSVLEQIELIGIEVVELRRRALTAPPSRTRGVALRQIKALDRRSRVKADRALQILESISRHPELL
jgi:hypothetical protein